MLLCWLTGSVFILSVKRTIKILLYDVAVCVCLLCIRDPYAMTWHDMPYYTLFVHSPPTNKMPKNNYEISIAKLLLRKFASATVYIWYRMFKSITRCSMCASACYRTLWEQNHKKWRSRSWMRWRFCACQSQRITTHRHIRSPMPLSVTREILSLT